ncbi:MAG TPA: Gfo/Idh/MocA family oxidoreductase [Chryseosolibacter sp.]|nr:Gfo/Idh/MocA family oxidoreductase [Chryseosolibacter sp.]
MKKFALIGAAGYIAPRHMKAIKDTGNVLVAALDKHDNVGILDSYFPDCHFFTEFERFDRHLDKLNRKGEGVDYISICTPNYLHDAHIRFALRSGADVICEKPLVLNPWNLEALDQFEKETSRSVSCVLQLRLHPVIIDLRKHVLIAGQKKYEVDLTYITSRGNWYFSSWKGELARSGGVATNIGIHFFDILQWIFGPVVQSFVYLNEPSSACGFLELERANVRWFLSIDYLHIPESIRLQGLRTYRSLRLEGKELEFSEGFGDLHSATYREVLAGRGFSLYDAAPSVRIVHSIRTSIPVEPDKDSTIHPYLKKMQ